MSDTADHLEREIENHRANVEETLDKLKGRLSVDQVVDDIGQFIGLDDVRGTLASAGRQVRENPLALGMIGVGMVWLMMGQSSKDRSSQTWGGAGERDESYTPYSGAWPAGDRQPGANGMMERAGDMASDMKEKAVDAASGVTGKVSAVASGVTEKVTQAASDLTGSVKGMAAGVADKLHARDLVKPVSERLEQQPLLLGAVALVAGAVIGAALPRTRTEDRLLGEPRARLMEEAKAATRGMKDRAVEAAHRTYDAAVRAAEDEGLVPSGDTTLAEKVEHVATAAVGEARNQVEPLLHGSDPDDADAMTTGSGKAGKTKGSRA